MKRVILFGIMIVSSFCRAQAQDYTLSVTKQTYEELTNPVVIAENPDRDTLINYFIPFQDFSFRAFGADLMLDTIGGAFGTFVTVEGVLGALEKPGTGEDSIISFHAFLSNFLSGRKDKSSSISYMIEGAPGKTVLKVQWKNMGFTNHEDGDYVNFQVWLNQADYSISYHYGASIVTSLAGFSGAQGPVIGLSKASPDFSVFKRSLYLTGKADAPSIKHPNGLSVAMNEVPDNGLIYTFYPVSTAVPEQSTDAISYTCFPNPFSQNITFSVHSQENHRVLLYNALGMEMASAAGQERITIDRGNLASGMYFYRMLKAGKLVASGRVMVR